MEIWQTIKEDHRSVRGLIEQIEAGSADRDGLRRRLRHELAAHTAGEEIAVYPELRKIEGFAPLLDRSLEEHSEARQLLLRLDSAGGQVFSDLIARLRSIVRDHVEEEEAKIIPMAQKKVPGHVVEHMTHEFEKAKQAVLDTAR